MRFIRRYRFPVALVLLTAFLAAAVGAKETPPWSITPVPRQDAWWQERQAEKNELVKKGNVDMIFVGDSITHSWENGGKQTWKKYYGPRNAVNLGFSGDRVEHVLWRLDNGNIDNISPKLAVLMIGTNNAASPPGKIAKGIEMIVEKLREKLPKTKVLGFVGKPTCHPERSEGSRPITEILRYAQNDNRPRQAFSDKA